MRTESGEREPHAQQLRVEQVERFAVVEQQLQKFQQEQEKLKGNEERGRVEQVERFAVVGQQLKEIQQEQEKRKDNEERWRIVEQKLGEPGVGPGERERQQRLEERLRIVEQQWRNRHARELEEQARLLQALRDEQERLRHEQEKIRNNKKSRERRAGKATQRARARVGSELHKIRGYVGDARWQRPRTCL